MSKNSKRATSFKSFESFDEIKLMKVYVWPKKMRPRSFLTSSFWLVVLFVFIWQIFGKVGRFYPHELTPANGSKDGAALFGDEHHVDAIAQNTLTKP